ncbi:hypothetical protein TUBRATIS_004030 [Tubulinosema ratisbonensis]|uniref:Uncharacterized protein n=1 Tax=Tubulinosema ratisbonensis TaxID=291195 RepID=A0A437APX9_9MICR|nr:hypothetical protein TUBRATIS_004030 [Tubulinosema ratisbonensis]
MVTIFIYIELFCMTRKRKFQFKTREVHIKQRKDNYHNQTSTFNQVYPGCMEKYDIACVLLSMQNQSDTCKTFSSFECSKIEIEPIKCSEPQVLTKKRFSKGIKKTELERINLRKKLKAFKLEYEEKYKQEKPRRRFPISFHIWRKVNFSKIIYEFDRKFQFNLLYFLKTTYNIRNLFKKGSNLIKETSNSNITKLFLTIYNKQSLAFKLEESFLNYNDFIEVYEKRCYKLKIRYAIIQKEIINFFDNKLLHASKNRLYHFKDYETLFNKEETNSNDSKEVLIFAMEDFFSFNDSPFLKFLFPESKIIKKILSNIPDFSFLKRLHYFASIFRLQYILFRENFKEELLRFKRLKESDFLNCEIFIYFLFSSKIILQKLIMKYSHLDVETFHKFVFQNFILFLKMKNEKIREILDFNFLFTYNVENNDNILFDYNFETEYYDGFKKIFCKKIIYICDFPKLEDLKEYFNSVKHYTMLIDKIDDLTGISDHNYVKKNYSANEIRSIFANKFYSMFINEIN